MNRIVTAKVNGRRVATEDQCLCLQGVGWPHAFVVVAGEEKFNSGTRKHMMCSVEDLRNLKKQGLVSWKYITRHKDKRFATYVNLNITRPGARMLTACGGKVFYKPKMRLKA